MNARSYKIILVLLSFCLLSILLVQGIWIRNAYHQRMDEFNRTVYQTLEQITARLQERENLRALKMTYFIQNGDTIVKTPSRRITVASESDVKMELNNNPNGVQVKQIISVKAGSNKQKRKDSVTISTKNNSGVNIILSGSSSRIIVNKPGEKPLAILKDQAAQAEEMNKLVDKMITEIKVIDVEDNNADTLRSLIRRDLENKGIFIPFEFSMQKLFQNKKQVLAQSKDFNEAGVSYKSDLSAKKVFSTHNFLFLQFPAQNSLVLSAMKSSILLSVLFSLIIIGTFYYTIRLILKQKKISEIKSDFVNNMTHELKTPIATISLAVDGLNHPMVRNDVEKMDEYTRILKEENHKLNDHVERVLQMALLEKGELQLHQQPVDLVSVIRSAIDAYTLQIQQKKASVNFISAEDRSQVNADALHLSNVFTNLLDNALKYSREQERCRIDISVVKHNGSIHISFKDNGIGIAASQRDKVFEKFYRVQGGNLHDVKGFGLGLSYVRSVVEAHGGSIELRSEAGKGSEFIILLRSYAG